MADVPERAVFHRHIAHLDQHSAITLVAHQAVPDGQRRALRDVGGKAIRDRTSRILRHCQNAGLCVHSRHREAADHVQILLTVHLQYIAGEHRHIQPGKRQGVPLRGFDCQVSSVDVHTVVMRCLKDTTRDNDVTGAVHAVQSVRRSRHEHSLARGQEHPVQVNVAAGGHTNRHTGCVIEIRAFKPDVFASLGMEAEILIHSKRHIDNGSLSRNGDPLPEGQRQRARPGVVHTVLDILYPIACAVIEQASPVIRAVLSGFLVPVHLHVGAPRDLAALIAGVRQIKRIVYPDAHRVRHRVSACHLAPNRTGGFIIQREIGEQDVTGVLQPDTRGPFRHQD